MMGRKRTVDKKISRNTNDEASEVKKNDRLVKWHKFNQRTIWTIIMILSYILILISGPIYCKLLVLVLCTTCYFEILNCSVKIEKENMFKQFFWYILGLMGAMKSYIVRKLSNTPDSVLMRYGFGNKLMRTFIEYIPMLDLYASLALYILALFGLFQFIASLEVKHLPMKLRSMIKTLLVCLFVVVQGVAQIKTIDIGLIWFIISTLSVIVNDIVAYLFGCKYGKTRLIQISPNKTLEGFLGASLITIMFSIIVGNLLGKIKIFTCSDINNEFVPLFWNYSSVQCKPSTRFLYTTMKLWKYELSYKPAWFDLTLLGLFASFFAPIGGLLASAYKRYLGIKDFGTLIPGHGGLTDRFDCQSIMGMFTYLYVRTIASSDAINMLIRHAKLLALEDKIILIKHLIVENNINIASLYN